MKHGIDAAIDAERGGHVLLDARETHIAVEMRKVLRPPRDEVVDADDLVAPRQQAINEVRAHEPCPSCDERARHQPPPALTSLGRIAPSDLAMAARGGLIARRPTEMYVKPSAASAGPSRQFRPSITNGRLTRRATWFQSRLTYSGHSVTRTTASAPVTQAYGSSTSLVSGRISRARWLATGSVAVTRAPRSS